MKITNNLDLPEPIVRAVEKETYDKGRSGYSVTELIKPPQIRYLEKKHWDDVEEDVSDLVRSLSGQLFHTLMERAGTGENEIVERRFYYELDGETIGGQADLIDLNKYTLYDYKDCSPWAVIDGIKPEWEQQLNLLDYLAYQNGIRTANLAVMAKFDGWSEKEAARNSKYPNRRVGVFHVRKWNRQEQFEFLKKRLYLHKQAHETGKPIECTPEEKWEKPTKYALMKGGRKSAVKLFDDMQDLENYCIYYDIELNLYTTSKQGQYYYEIRLGEATRCERFCYFGAKSGLCPQFRKENNAKSKNSN